MSARRGVGRAVAARTLGPPTGPLPPRRSGHDPQRAPAQPTDVALVGPNLSVRRRRSTALHPARRSRPGSRRAPGCPPEVPAVVRSSSGRFGARSALSPQRSEHSPHRDRLAVRGRSIERYQPSGPRPLGVRRSERERSPGRSRTPTSAPSALSVPAASTVARAAGATTRSASRQPAVPWPAARRSPLSGVVTVGPAAAAAA